MPELFILKKNSVVYEKEETTKKVTILNGPKHVGVKWLLHLPFN